MSRKKYFCQATKVANKESFPIHADSSTSFYLASDSIDVEKERERWRTKSNSFASKRLSAP